MNNSERLRLSDVRHVFRLLGEIRELGADPIAWRRHMLKSLGQLVGMVAGTCGESLYVNDDPSAPVLVPESMADFGGPAARDWGTLASFLVSSEAPRCPVFREVTRWQTGGRTRNYSAGWIEPDFDARAWHSSPLQERVRAAGLGEPLFSIYALPEGCASHCFGVARGPGEAAFTQRHVRIMQLFHAELSRLWRVPPADVWPDLSPRLHQTLERLQSGLSEKQIAHELGLSPHTVHNYIKELHRRFDVASRGELLARCAAERSHSFYPRLTTQH